MIGILGAGSLGRLWGAMLPAGGIAFIARPGEPTGASVDYRFRPFKGPESQVRIPFLQPGDEPELILVTTKAGDTLDAVAGVINQFAIDTPILLFQNGLGSQQAVAKRWPERPILAASTTEGANRPESGLLVHAGTGDTWVGPMTSPAKATVRKAVTMLATSGLNIHPETDIVQRLWQKLIINAGINPYTAILDCPNGKILDAPLYQSTIDQLCLELSQLMDAAVRIRQTPDALRERIEQVARNTAGNTSSMRADVQRGRQTEIDFINGYVAKLGKELGIETPVNQMLTERVQQLS
ncbi:MULTISPECIES: ketopantoate reductase family protein [Marinobacter]|jgi:2-dehydropantoate 2-reductase|uniref:2-dehydropantoate 2-reductase n=1 Tax=Marinobacter sp. MMG032 TaxID=3158548 RepID=A0AAU7MP76_9GAMM|nr:ketopantoate reductase family protein [Marinobacter sp.]MBO6811611.1 ketopantoate reductase family protein [Marinobacter sp.]MBO6875176.1 ketopantoate reductase family protein [Marinobacter sp.]|tara:strand:- start:2665 stop:3552 length:888 start_codon:yes stop_codon:yes gene_type:complete